MNNNINIIEQEGSEYKSSRTHRVGSITAGFTLIVWGLMFILNELKIFTDSKVILELWPLILIGLGIEILCSLKKDGNVIYDKGAVFLMIIMAGFSAMMAVIQLLLRLEGIVL